MSKNRWEQFNSIVENESIDLKEKALLLILFRYINYEKKYADPSRATLKRLTGISDNRTLDKIFDSLINKGLLVRESGKGVRSKYFIKVGGEITPSGEIALSVGGEITPQKENKKKIKENIYNYCQNDGTNNEITMKEQLNLYSDSENKKEDSNEVDNIFDYWNSKGIIKHKKITQEIKKEVTKVLKEYSAEEVKQAIDVYSEILNSEFYFSHKWSLSEFLKRKNGISTFMEEGFNRINYEEWKSKDKAKEKTIEEKLLDMY